MTLLPVGSKKQLVLLKFFLMSRSEDATTDLAMQVFRMAVVVANTNSMISLIYSKRLAICLAGEGCSEVAAGLQEHKKAVTSFVKSLFLYSRLHAVKARRSTFVDMKNAQPVAATVRKLEPHHRHVIIAVARAKFFKALGFSGCKQHAPPAVAQEV
jgi:hypothetical protein